MPSERFEPARLTRAELDEYLARGWYRIGSQLITTDFLEWRGQLRSTIWTRLDLRGHRFKRSLRKLMARNERQFQVSVGELVVDRTREQLYARYRDKVGGERVESLEDVLGGEPGRALFDTHEVRVFHGDRLVAFSWFDVGERSAESVIGVYDPAFSEYSLGLYTLLLEIRHTAEMGMHFHYAGYVLAEPSAMDYKRRVGNLQFFDPETREWLSRSPFDPSRSPAEILRQKLDAAEEALRWAGVGVGRYVNFLLRDAALLEKYPQYPPQPVLLVCGIPGCSWVVLVAWDPHRGTYRLMSGRGLAVSFQRGAPVGASHHGWCQVFALGESPGDARAPGSGEARPPTTVHLFVVEEQLGERSSAGEIAQLARIHLPRITSRSESPIGQL